MLLKNFGKFLKSKDNLIYKLYPDKYEKLITSFACFSVKQITKIIEHLLVLKGKNPCVESLVNDYARVIEQTHNRFSHSVDPGDSSAKKAYSSIKEKYPYLEEQDFLKMTDVSNLNKYTSVSKTDEDFEEEIGRFLDLNDFLANLKLKVRESVKNSSKEYRRIKISKPSSEGGVK